MPQISDIKLQKNKRVANVFVDGQFVAGLDLLTISKEGLKKSQEISREYLKKLITRSMYEKFLQRAINYISYRPRSVNETKMYLKRKINKVTQHAEIENIIEKIINTLKKKNLLNDEEFVDWWMHQRTKFKPKGNFMIAQELRKKGVDMEIIKRKLKGRDEMKAAKLVVKKKSKRFSKNDPKAREKMIGYLRRRGFNWNVIKKLID